MENAQTENLKAKKSMWQAMFTKPMLLTMLMGFSSGLPLLLTLKTLQAWMTDIGVDLKTVGIFSLASLPYSLKFLWAPFMDKYNLFGLGRRRGWLFFTQTGLLISLLAMAFIEPREQTWLMAAMAVLVSFLSASQDIVIDAYRRETLADQDLALGSSFYIYGYRGGMWVAGGFALFIAEIAQSWTVSYLLMAAFMSVGILTTVWSSEPEIKTQLPRSIKETVIDPFLEFLRRHGAWSILLFILLYKLGDTMAGAMLTPFYLKIGYSKAEIAVIAKTFSLPIVFLGAFIGGVLTQKWGIIRCLWIFGIGQMISTLSPILLLYSGHALIPLGAVILLEDLTQSMATASFIAYMMSQTNKKFTATQYALLSSLIGIPRSILAAPTGYLAEYFGWFGFFVFCTLIAIPGLLLIRVLSRRNDS